MKISKYMLLALTLVASPLTAQTINFQSYLMQDGEPMEDGDYSVTFRFYDQAEDGMPLWTEMQDLNVSGGLLNTELGSVEPFDTLKFDMQYWVSMEVDTLGEMGRLKLSYSPYAFHSMEAKHAMNSDSSMFAVNAEKAGHSKSTDARVTHWALEIAQEVEGDWTTIAQTSTPPVPDSTLFFCHAQLSGVDFLPEGGEDPFTAKLRILAVIDGETDESGEIMLYDPMNFINSDDFTEWWIFPVPIDEMPEDDFIFRLQMMTENGSAEIEQAFIFVEQSVGPR